MYVYLARIIWYMYYYIYGIHMIRIYYFTEDTQQTEGERENILINYYFLIIMKSLLLLLINNSWNHN